MILVCCVYDSIYILICVIYLFFLFSGGKVHPLKRFFKNRELSLSLCVGLFLSFSLSLSLSLSLSFSEKRVSSLLVEV